MTSIDRRIAEAAFAYHGKHPGLDTVARFVARALIILLFVSEATLFAHLMWALDGRHTEMAFILHDIWAGIRIPLALLVSTWLISVLTEVAIGRKRPFRALGKKPLGTFWVPTPSMPSSHAAISFALALPLFAISPWLGVFGIVCAILVAASRVYVGVHYLSDVIVGALLGIALTAIIGHALPL